ncbi:hypothetical protein AAG594_10960 [Citromicrobium bathyomarinum]
MTYMTMRKLCEYSGWDFKKSSDDRTNGADFILTGKNGRYICDLDDCAAAFAYVHLREAGANRPRGRVECEAIARGDG